jgi:hypothetical protein
MFERLSLDVSLRGRCCVCACACVYALTQAHMVNKCVCARALVHVYTRVCVLACNKALSPLLAHCVCFESLLLLLESVTPRPKSGGGLTSERTGGM